MNYVKRVGKIINFNSQNVVVELQEKNSQVCSEKGCHLCSSPSGNTQILKAQGSSENISVGETVIVNIYTINEAVSAFLIFMIPLIITIISSIILTSLNISTTLLTIITVAVFFLSFIVPITIDKLIRTKNPIYIEKFHGSC